MYVQLFILFTFLFQVSGTPAREYRPHAPLRISEENGLSSNVVNYIHPSPDGLICFDRETGILCPDIDDPRIDFVHAERIGLTPEEFVSKDIVNMEENTNCLPIRIRHPLWCQWWSFILYFVLLHLILRFYANIREKKHLIEKTRLERMVSERTSDLKREMNLKNKFFSILSHDLKSPINGAAFITDVFLRQYDRIPEEQRKEMLEVLHLSLMSSSDMLNSIMLWRQSQSTDIEPNYQKINLKETCRQVADMHSAAYHRKNVSLDIDIPDDMFVMTDKNILSTILRNLLGNALKYSYHNGRVRLFCTGREDKVYVSVQDFGTGMDEHTRNSLFRMDETCRRKGTDSESGSGLGLLIISEFLKKIGESIKIESEPEKGSIFTFTLRNLHQESY